jgi:hypothetical protein
MNGKKEIMVEQINYYGMRKFWEDMRDWMQENCIDYDSLVDILIIYMRINEL